LGRNGSGYDSLEGLDSDSLWTLANADLKSLYATKSRALDFSYMDSLIGGSGADNFVFGDGVSHDRKYQR
jgi:hypothetical protein